MIPKGATFDNKSNKYKAYVNLGGYKVRIGLFSTEAEAIRAAEEYRNQFRTKEGIYDLNSIYTDAELCFLYGAYLMSKYKKSFRCFVFDVYFKRIKLDVKEAEQREYTKVIGMFLSTNTITQISKYMNIPRRQVESEVNQFRFEIQFGWAGLK